MAYKSESILTLLLLPMLLLLANCQRIPIGTTTEPLAVGGTLDLRQHEFHPILPLRGEWIFFPMTTYEELLSNNIKGVPTSLPSSWHPELIDGPGHGVYQVKIVLPAEQMQPGGEALALRMPLIPSAYRVYLDGTLLAENGNPYPGAEKIEPGARIRTLYFYHKKEEINIHIEVSNYFHIQRGITENIYFGKSSEIFKLSANLMTIEWIGLIWLYGLSIYYLAFAYIDRSQIVARWMALFLFGYGSLHGVFGDAMVFANFTSEDYMTTLYRFGEVANAITLCAGGAAILELIRSKQLRPIKFIYIAICVLFAIAMTVAPITHLSAIALEVGLPLSMILFTLIFVMIYQLITTRSSDSLHLASMVLPAINYIYIVLTLNDYLPQTFLIRPLAIFSYLIFQTMAITITINKLIERGKRVNLELQAQTEELEQMVQQRSFNLRVATQWKRDISSLISHDLKSPLIALQHLFRSIEQENGIIENSERRNSTHKVVASNLDYLKKMVEEILDQSRFGQNLPRLKLQPSLAAEIVERAIQTCQLQANHKSVKLKPTLKNSGPIDCDFDLIVEALKNGIQNSIRFAPNESSIEVVYECGSDGHHFSIIDQGPGFDSAKLQELSKTADLLAIDPERNSQTIASSSGLGLKLTLRIVHAHSGRLQLENRAEGGALFRLTLPIEEGESSLVLGDEVVSKGVEPGTTLATE